MVPGGRLAYGRNHYDQSNKGIQPSGEAVQDRWSPTELSRCGQPLNGKQTQQCHYGDSPNFRSPHLLWNISKRQSLSSDSQRPVFIHPESSTPSRSSISSRDFKKSIKRLLLARSEKKCGGICKNLLSMPIGQTISNGQSGYWEFPSPGSKILSYTPWCGWSPPGVRGL